MTNRPTKVPGIPKPPTELGHSMRAYLTALAEAVEIRLGRRGDPRDRAVTLRELIDSGLAKELRTRSFDPNNYDSSNLGIAPTNVVDPTVPPAPVNFTAAGAYSVINLSWTAAFYASHAFTEIYAHDSDAIGDAQLIGITSGFTYSDPVGSGVTRYYWVRFVSASGVIGPFNNGSGTAASTATDVAHQLAVLSGAIRSSELAQSLAAPISNLPADTTSSIANIQSQINTLSNVATWASGTSYSANDLVTYSGKLYEAQSAHTASASNQPTGTTSSNATWTFVGEYTSLASAVAGNTGDITDINFIDASSGSASAQKLASLDATVTNPTTGLVATRATLVNDYSTTVSMNAAIASATTNLATTTYVTTELAAYTNTASLNLNYYTKTGADSAISAAVTDFQSATEVQALIDGSLTSYTTSADLTQNHYTKTSADSAISAAITVAQSGFTNPDGSSSTVTLQQAMSTQANINGDLEGQYSVKIDNRGHIAGFGLSNTSTTAGPTSAFIVRADKFAVINPSDNSNGLGTTTPSADNVPFFIDGGDTYIKSAMIQDASITNAKIGTVDADKISSGFISANRIDAGSIDVFKLDLVGTGANINLQSAASGARMIIRDTKILVYDGSGALRVKLGEL